MRYALIVGLLLCTGCAGVRANLDAAHRADPLDGLLAFSVADLQAAIALSTAGADDAATMCYQFVLGEVVKAQAAPRPALGASVAGPISEIQRFRNGLHAAQSSSSRTFFGQLDLHCASYRTSVELDLVRGAFIGGAVAGGNPLPALKLLGPLLGLPLPL